MEKAPGSGHSGRELAGKAWHRGLSEVEDQAKAHVQTARARDSVLGLSASEARPVCLAHLTALCWAELPGLPRATCEPGTLLPEDLYLPPLIRCSLACGRQLRLVGSNYSPWACVPTCEMRQFDQTQLHCPRRGLVSRKGKFDRNNCRAFALEAKGPKLTATARQQSVPKTL